MENAKNKITGAEYKAFLNSEAYWPATYCHDDVLLIIDGEEYGDDRDLIVEDIPDSASIVIECGCVMDRNVRIHDLAEYFYRWQDEQMFETLVVKVLRSDAEKMRGMIRASGGEIA